MALQARRALAGEEGASHRRLLVGERRELLRDVRDGLRRERLKKPPQLLNLDGREVEGWHAGLEVPTHAVPVRVFLSQGRVRQEAGEPFRTDACALRDQAWRQLTFPIWSLKLGQGHQHRLLI